MNVKFNYDCLNELLDKLSKKNKTIFVLDGFNINLLKYGTHPPINEFLLMSSSHYFLHHILQLAQVNSNCKTYIDNIFCNMTVSNTVYHNLTAAIYHTTSTISCSS